MVKNKVLIVIPARYGSTRFLGKPLALINGKPMIYWTYCQAQKVRGVTDIIVATDSVIIKDECEKMSIPVMVTSEKHRTGTDRLTEVADNLSSDIYVNIQGDEPLIEPEVIETLVNFMRENENYICATVRAVIDDPVDAVNRTVSKVVTDINDDIMYISRHPIPYPKASIKYTYYKALGIYAFRKEALEIYKFNGKATNEEAEDIELLRLVERGVKVKDILVESHSPSVDTPKDILRIEEMMNSK